METRDFLDGLGTEAVVGWGSVGLLNDVAEGIVALAGNDGARGVDPSGYVAVAIVGGEAGDWFSAASR